MVKKIILGIIVVGIVIIAAFYFTKTPAAQAPVETNTNTQSSDQISQTTDTETVPPTTTQPITNNNSTTPMDLSQQKTPITVVDPNKSYVAKMKTTAGEMDIELNVKATPITVNNFVFLAKKNYYENVIFHRVIKGFMIQGGDPTGTGAGGPGYTIPDESFQGEYLKGTVAMARTSAPNSAGSQFFIMHDDYPLPPEYVIFGQVVSGLDVIDIIAEAPTTLGSDGQMSKPVNPVKILSVEIIER